MEVPGDDIAVTFNENRFVPIVDVPARFSSLTAGRPPAVVS
jgi:hypothetical protein